ncbi:MAG: hypothetical protein IJY36_00655 [Coprobacter sp.]|nr:hypothetical protein [Coprobacter sp.]
MKRWNFIRIFVLTYAVGFTLMSVINHYLRSETRTMEELLFSTLIASLIFSVVWVFILRKRV